MIDRREVEKKIKDVNSKDVGDEIHVPIDIDHNILSQSTQSSLNIASQSDVFNNPNMSHMKPMKNNLTNKIRLIGSYNQRVVPYQSSAERNVKPEQNRSGLESDVIVRADNAKTTENIKHSIENILKKDHENNPKIKWRISPQMEALKGNFPFIESAATDSPLFGTTDGSLRFFTPTDYHIKTVYRRDISLHLQKSDHSRLMMHLIDSQKQSQQLIHQFETRPDKYPMSSGQRLNTFSG